MSTKPTVEYSTRETSYAPYNRTLEVAREEVRASGLIVPADIALLAFEQDPEKLAVPDGITLPSPDEVFLHVMSKQYDSDRHERRRFQNIQELHDSLTQFVVLALTTGKDFTLRYSDAANEDEVYQFRKLAQTQITDDSLATDNYGSGLYL